MNCVRSLSKTEDWGTWDQERDWIWKWGFTSLGKGSLHRG